MREADGIPIIHEVIAIDAERFAGLESEPEVLPNTLYQLYQKHFGSTVHLARERITAEPAPEVSAGELGVAAAHPVLKIERIAVDFGGTALEYGVSWVNTSALHYETQV